MARITTPGSAGSSSGPVLVNVKTQYGAKGDNATDDTAAIQAAIDAVVAAGGGTAFFPKGIYLVGGALRTTATSGGGGRPYRAQITLPDIDQATGQKIVLKLIGEQPQGTFAGLTTSTAPAYSGGSIIRSTLTGQTYSAVTGWPSLIGGPDDVANSQFAFTNLMVETVDLGFRAASNPSITLLNLERIASANVRRCLFDTDDALSAIVRPTNPSGRGLILPGQNNNTMVHAEDVAIQAMFTGVKFSEHTHLDTVQVFECTIAIDPNSRGHSAQLSNIGVEWCPYVFAHVTAPATQVTGTAFTSADYGMIGDGGTNAYFDVLMLSIEDSNPGSGSGAAWTAPVNHVNDPGNRYFAMVTYQRAKAQSGVQATGWTVSGGGNMRARFLPNGGGIEVGGTFFGSLDTLRQTGGTGTVSFTRGPGSATPGVKTKAGSSGKAVGMYSGTGSPFFMFDSGVDLVWITDTSAAIDGNTFATTNIVGRLTKDGAFRPKQYTTAGRPAAATVGAGGMIFDTTLGKPVWSDGTSWRDAAGTVV